VICAETWPANDSRADALRAMKEHLPIMMKLLRDHSSFE
jgi:hypothetical protein